MKESFTPFQKGNKHARNSHNEQFLKQPCIVKFKRSFEMIDTTAVCWEAISCLSGRAKGCGNVCKKVFGKSEVVEEEPFDGHFHFSKF